jgi:methyl-accepting chemotaxis protein-like sensor
MPETIRAENPENAARRALGEVVRLLDRPRDRVRACAASFAAIADAARAEGRPARRADLEALVPLLRETVRELPVGVDGTGVVAAPGFLADAPLWLEWWRRGPDGEPDRLEVTFDPEHPAHFDYPEAEWFSVPQRQGIPWIAGPFVDSGGTNRHLCTYSVPVYDGDGTFVGIAGADLRVGYVERVARRALAAIDVPAVLVNRDARVIGSNEPELAAATLLDPEWIRAGERNAGAVAWDVELPWGVALVPPAHA